MKIFVVGTSNSVMGNKGYIEALRLEHDVVQLSSGRTPFYSCMKTIVNHKDEIESSDLLIIDHYINDVNFYGSLLGEPYKEHLKLFYSYLSALNVNILNLMFPIQDLEQRESIDLYHQTKSLCEQHSISVLDLNKFNIPKEFYSDLIHLTHDVSYALGLSLNKGLSKVDFDNVDFGTVSDFPFYSLSASKIPNNRNKSCTFKNSLICVEYLKLEHEITVHVPKGHKLIALGLLLDKTMNGRSGFELNDEQSGVSGGGYFLETVEQTVCGDFTISPLSGYHEVRNMMGRGISKGLFTYFYIVDFLFFDTERNMEFNSAIRKSYNIDISQFISLSNKFVAIGNREPSFPKISPKSVNKLRELALSLEVEDLKIARDLMLLANLARPDGPVIKTKLAEYEKALNGKSKVN
ncbi:hypothetical protein [Vibrio sp. H11]|uniref:hypothetical protein n=1 Tax=Vibrio sp. H11 TaxID=2565928 RepID=UPI0010A6ADA2|nr:hypothetical protein [Vibrio sp. H11]